MSKQLLTLIAFLLTAVLALSACGGGSVSTPAPAAAQPAAPAKADTHAVAVTGTDSDGDGIPNDAEKVLGTDPNNADTDGDGQNDLADAQPLFADNPISESSTTAGFTIDAIAVENNVDASGAGVVDHLEMKVSNSTQKDITGFDIYYTFTDSVTGDQQAYYRKLDGFTLKAGESKSLHLDSESAAEHFSVNPNSVFYANPNLLKVDVILHATGYAPQSTLSRKPQGKTHPADTPRKERNPKDDKRFFDTRRTCPEKRRRPGLCHRSSGQWLIDPRPQARRYRSALPATAIQLAGEAVAIASSRGGVGVDS